jgi:hypothetical protein
LFAIITLFTHYLEESMKVPVVFILLAGCIKDIVFVKPVELFVTESTLTLKQQNVELGLQTDSC